MRILTGGQYCDTDAGLAISNMTLAAWNHGVGSCIIGACDKSRTFQYVWT